MMGYPWAIYSYFLHYTAITFQHEVVFEIECILMKRSH